jgi:hypothetical protein
MEEFLYYYKSTNIYGYKGHAILQENNEDKYRYIYLTDKYCEIESENRRLYRTSYDTYGNVKIIQLLDKIYDEKYILELKNRRKNIKEKINEKYGYIIKNIEKLEEETSTTCKCYDNWKYNDYEIRSDHNGGYYLAGHRVCQIL